LSHEDTVGIKAEEEYRAQARAEVDAWLETLYAGERGLPVIPGFPPARDFDAAFKDTVGLEKQREPLPAAAAPPKVWAPTSFLLVLGCTMAVLAAAIYAGVLLNPLYLAGLAGPPVGIPSRAEIVVQTNDDKGSYTPHFILTDRSGREIAATGTATVWVMASVYNAETLDLDERQVYSTTVEVTPKTFIKTTLRLGAFKREALAAPMGSIPRRSLAIPPGTTSGTVYFTFSSGGGTVEASDRVFFV